MLLGGKESMFLPAAEPVRLAGHLTMGGIAAFGLAYMKLGRRGWPGRLISGFVAAVALHITWDIVAFDAADRGRMSMPHTISSMIIMLGGMVIFRSMVRIATGETRGWGTSGPATFQLQLEPGRAERRHSAARAVS
jgi:hypothetical protein